MGTANFGIAGLDWQQRVNWERLKKYRTERAREHMKKHGLGAMLCMYDENVRYLTGTLTPGWNRLKPGLRYALLCGDGAPVLFEQGDLGFQIERHSPWIPKENVRYSYAWIKGAAGPASQQQVKKFTDAILYEMKRHGVAGQKLGVDFIDINMISIFKDKKINWVDGMTPMMEARAVKNADEQECMRIVGAIGDATHWECMKFLRPGITENQVTAHLMKYLYSIPGMEDVEDVIVSSGPNTWPNWRNFSDRIIQPGDIVFMDLAALTWNGYKSCYYRTYCVGKEPTREERYLRDRARMALRFDSRGQSRDHHAGNRQKVAVREASLGLQGRGPGGGKPVGPRAWAGAIRSAGDLAHLVARSSGRDQGGNDVRARDPAWQALSLRRAHRGDADRAQEGDRDHLQLPGQADHGGRPDPRLRRSREVTRPDVMRRRKRDAAENDDPTSITRAARASCGERTGAEWKRARHDGVHH
jgi:Xaa-Pro aminopeptidase